MLQFLNVTKTISCIIFAFKTGHHTFISSVKNETQRGWLWHMANFSPGWNTSHLVSQETTSLHMLMLYFQPGLKFHFDNIDILWIFQAVCQSWKSQPGFWNWARIFSPGQNSDQPETFSVKSALLFQEDFFQNPGWNSPCNHPLSAYCFSCL